MLLLNTLQCRTIIVLPLRLINFEAHFRQKKATNSSRGVHAIGSSQRASVHRRPAAAPLVFLAGTAGTRIVPLDLGSSAPTVVVKVTLFEVVNIA
jgi:hypothetical protein